MGKNADLGPTPKRVNADKFRIHIWGALTRISPHPFLRGLNADRDHTHFWGALTRILTTPIFEGP